MNSIINAAIEHFRVVLLCLFIIFVGGLISYANTPKEAEPDITIPIIYVHMHHDGISPEDSARLLIKPMEVTLRTIEGVKELRGIAQEDGASLVIEFNAGIDPDQAILDVREQVDKARSELPDETDEPSVTEINFSEFPIINIVLYGDAPERALYTIARNLRDDLESIPSVLEAKVTGDREDLLEVVIDPLRLESYKLSHTDILSVVSNNNKLVAAGSLDNGTGRFSVKVPGIFQNAQDVYDLPVKVSGNSIVTLSDVAEIRRSYKDPTSYSRFNGKPSINIAVSKRAGQNAIDTVEAVKRLIETRSQNWPTGINYTFVGDRSEEINNSVSSLENSVISAILLVAVAIVAALGNRSALLVAISIPGSFLLSIFLIYMFGMAINQVIMFGLILSVGLLVDGAIVVSEYADRKMQEGLHKKDAYRMASQRMAWPILSSTATTLAAFFPLLFWPGIAGEFMSYLPLTLIFTLSASFLMALIFMPTLGSKIGKKADIEDDTVAQLAAGHFDVKTLKGFTGSYVRLVDRLIRRPFRLIFVLFALLFSIVILFVQSGTPVEFFPEDQPQQVALQVHARGNMSLDEKDVLVRKVENLITDVEGIKNIQSETLATVSTGSNATEDVIGKVTVHFDDWDRRRRSDLIIEDLRQRVSNIPGVLVEVVRPDFGPTQGKDIQIDVRANDVHKARQTAEIIFQHMEQNVQGLMDLDTTLPLPGIQWELQVDRALAGLYGTDLLNVGSMVQLVTNGIKVGEYRPDDTDDEVDIRVRFPEQYRTLDQLDDVRVNTPEGLVPISNFVRKVAEQKISTIERIDTMPTYKIRANVVTQTERGQKVQELMSWIKQQNFDRNVLVKFVGQDEDQQESEDFLVKAFMMALFLMALILVAQFNSFYHAFLILLAVLLSTVGVLAGIMIFDRNFGIIMTGVGIISLAGIVVNNNIVLIDTFARLKKTGINPYIAIVQTVAQRLRPVLLTTFTTVIGLAPMVFQVNIDFTARNVEIGSPYSIIWVDLAVAVSVGLLFATVLTLLLTPCMLAARVKVENYFKKRRAQHQDSEDDPSRPAMAGGELGESGRLGKTKSAVSETVSE